MSDPGGDRRLGWLYVIGGLIGLAAAAALTLEKIAKLRDPGYEPTCSLNPIISCGSVMDSSQAEVFGFPNPLLGLVSFAVLVAVGVALLTGYRPPRWVWLGLQLGSTFGVLFVHWLIFESLYAIHALCPYCMVVWVVTIPIFFYTTLRNLKAFSGGRVTRVLARFHSAVLAVWFVAIAALILQAFWSYWTTLA